MQLVGGEGRLEKLLLECVETDSDVTKCFQGVDYRRIIESAAGVCGGSE